MPTGLNEDNEWKRCLGEDDLREIHKGWQARADHTERWSKRDYTFVRTKYVREEDEAILRHNIYKQKYQHSKHQGTDHACF